MYSKIPVTETKCQNSIKIYRLHFYHFKLLHKISQTIKGDTTFLHQISFPEGRSKGWEEKELSF